MSFDGVFTHLVTKKLSETLIGGRISKIHQPYQNEIILVIRSKGTNHKLLLSAHPSYARIQLTEIAYRNPETPPNFVMMLRKYLDGAILTGIKQLENDRVVHFTFNKRDELGDLQNIVLVVELMGRHSTILLLNEANGKILDAIKHIGSSQNSYRSILPGAIYIAPPKQDLLNPFSVNDVALFDALSQLPQLNGKALQQKFQGLGADTAQELAFRLKKNPNEKVATWRNFFKELEHIKPTLTVTETKEFFTPIVFNYLIKDAISQTNYPNLNELLDAFYGDKAERDRVKQQGGQLLKKVENELARNQTKLKKRLKTLKDSENAEEYRQKGELLTTFLHEVPKGANQVVLPNYYEEDRPLEIKLNPALSPNQNAQKYFHRYQKLKNAVKLIYQQIEEAKAEIAYLESVLAQIEIAGPMDLDLIKEELVAQGYLKKTTKRKKAQSKSQPDQYLTDDGTIILVGKNNLQNDQLTLKTARKTDYWLHTKNIPGSHVIIKSSDPSEETILAAAELAAYFSKYRHSAQVPVDLVQVKYIKKPNGAKPGYVIYENQKTYYVTPEEDIVTRLQKQ
ncbi:fibronectin-binding protein EfbA [Enterococcus canintestini]|uniref:Rqc2 homolog RqcH n=1 Tax=Enterococcus canintestini TaxID=317010 RepID=A0A267HWL6_9ENTE|nr:fibronectin-binding protein EfbA [Enterococcus canintestini]PAB01988.1 fibronectin-binding protein [Enterococcus canintestini]